MYGQMTSSQIYGLRTWMLTVCLTLIVMTLVAACQPITLEEEMDGDDMAAALPTAAMPESTGLMLTMTSNDELGEFVIDGVGMTLYMYLRDEPGVTNCYDQCAQRWPPLTLAGDIELGAGVDESLVGTTERTDGGMQVTYNGWPLYYWVEDVAPGDTTGQGRGDVWFVLTPTGEIVGYTPPTLAVGTNEELGDYLVDGQGMTLYMYLNDEPGVTTCYDQCAQRWPPLLLEGDIKLADGVEEMLVETVERTDGGVQVTYNGWPLYYWVEDVAPGDTTGQARGDVWYLVAPNGEIIR